MSISACKWLKQNMPALRRVKYTDSSGRERNAFRGEGFALAFYLCEASNKYGTVFMTRETMHEETGIAKPEIERLLSAFIRGGFIAQVGEDRYHDRGRLTPVYGLVGIPNEYKPDKIEAENALITIPLTIPGESKNLVKPIHGKDITNYSDPEPEPKPDPDPKPDPQPVSAGAGKEGGVSFLEVLAGCIAWERTNFVGIDRGGLSKTWEKEYRQIIPTVLADQNPQSTEDAVNMCVTQRNASRGLLMPATSTSTTAKRDNPYGADPDCTHCNGEGLHMVRTDDDMGWTSRKCVCAGGTHTGTQEPTTKRVSTDESANTYIPTPGDTADPQSAIRELTKSLRMPG